jgi:hypothetical protein
VVDDVLKGTGTDAPASGDVIQRVEMQAWNGVSYPLPPVVLDTPSGGWTWAKVQALHLEMHMNVGETDSIVEAYDFDGGTLLGSALPATTLMSRTQIVVFSGIYLPQNVDTDLYEYQTNDGGTTLTFPTPVDAIGTKYYFDASDAGPTDVSSVWTDDAFGFDGDYVSRASSSQNGVLKATGTNAPSSGDTISTVHARTTIIGEQPNTQSWVLLDAPGGGWTWAKIQALHVDLQSNISGGDTVKVSDSDGGTVLGTLFDKAKSNFWVSITEIAVNIADEDNYLLIMATGDDNDIFWTAPTNFVEFFEVNDAGGDDASIGAWYAHAGDILTGTVDLVRSGVEELVGVMIVVQGADPTDFEDLAFDEGTHFVSTQNVDGSPNILPEPIDTITDGAVVIIFTGNRSDAGHLNWGGGPPEWDVIPSSGYTIESGLVQGTNATGAPGRLEQGTSNGDAQQTWMWKTVTSAGTETPGEITGFADGRDMKTATFAIRPDTSVGGAFDETGLTVSVVATVSGTDVGDFDELGFTVPVTVTVTGTDGKSYALDSLTVAITSTVTGTDAIYKNYDETGKTVAITSTVIGTDVETFTDSATIAITSSVTSTDILSAVDSGTVPITSTVTGTDVGTFTDSFTVPITSTVTGTDDLRRVFDETGKTVAITSTVTAADAQHYALDALTVAIVASVTGTDTQANTESASVAIVSSITGTEGLNYALDSLTVTIISTVTGTDTHNEGAVNYDETGLSVAITATVTSTDILTAIESGTVTVTSTVTGTDTFKATDSATVTITSSVTATDTATFIESSMVNVVATVTSTDGLRYDETGKTVAIVASVSSIQTQTAIETGLTVGVTSSISSADTAKLTDSASVAITATVTGTDSVPSSVPQVASLTSGDSTTDGTSIATSSVTPTGDALILAAVVSRIASGENPVVPTASGNGLTWVVVRTAAFGDLTRLTLFRAMGASPSAGAITFDFGSETQTDFAWSVAEYTDVDTSGTNGSGAVRQALTDLLNYWSQTTGTSLVQVVDEINPEGGPLSIGTFAGKASGTSPENIELTEDRGSSNGIAGMVAVKASGTIEYVGTETAHGIVTSDTLTINKPAGVVSGDVMYALIVHESGSGTSITWTPPSGWTRIGPLLANLGQQGEFYYKVAGGSEPSSYAFETDVANEMSGSIVALTNVDAAPNADTDTDGDTNGPADLTVTPSAAADWLVMFAATESSTVSTGAALAPGLMAFLDTNSVTYAVAAKTDGADAEMTGDSNMTDLHDVHSAGSERLYSQYEEGEELVADWSWTTARSAVAFNLEIISGTAGSVNYDETGKTVAIVATVNSTDVASLTDSATVAITSTVTGNDVIHRSYDETGKTVAITSSVTSTDALHYALDALTVAIVSTVTGTDDLNRAYDETGKTVAIAASVSGTDILSATDSLTVSISSSVSSTDVASFVGSFTVAIVSSVTGTDTLIHDGVFDETGKFVNIIATVTATDVASLTESTTVAIVATVTGTDVHNGPGTVFDETGKLVAVVSSVSGTDTATFSGLTQYTAYAKGAWSIFKVPGWPSEPPLSYYELIDGNYAYTYDTWPWGIDWLGAIHTFEIDMGSAHAVDRITWGQPDPVNYPTKISIRSSDDGVIWDLRATFTGLAYDDPENGAITFPQHTARHWSIQEDGGAAGNGAVGWQLNEFDLLVKTTALIEIIATVTGSDNFGFTETGLAVDITSTVTSNDGLLRSESLVVNIVSTVTGTDDFAFGEHLTVNISADVSSVDILSATDSFVVAIVATVSSSDGFNVIYGPVTGSIVPQSTGMPTANPEDPYGRVSKTEQGGSTVASPTRSSKVEA